MDYSLYALQKLEKEKNRLEKESKSSPLKKNLQGKKQEIAALSIMLEEREQEYRQLEEQTDGLQKEIQSLTEEIQAREKALYRGEGLHFKELESLEEHIRNLREQLEEKNSILMGLMERAEELLGQTGSEKNRIREEKKIFNVLLADFREEEKIREEKIKMLTSEIAEVESGMSQEVLMKYRAMQKKFPLSGISLLSESRTCSYCRMGVSVVKSREVERGNIVYCENCSRLLVKNQSH